MNQGFLKQIESKNADELIHELKENHHFSHEQQGAMMLKLMQLKQLTRHNDVAELLGVSRSYVSIRTKKAKQQYPDMPSPKKKMGRPRHRIIDLDDFLQDEIPIRLVIKKDDLTNEEILLLLKRVVNNWPKGDKIP